MVKNMVKKITSKSWWLLWIVLLAGCAVNPVTGQRELVVVSDQQAIAIGNQQYAPSQQMQGGAFNTDPGLNKYVSEVGQRLARHSNADLPYEFVVLNNGVPNAWALPGGKIAINRGLLVELDNEAELAAVLAHEIVHAAARHGAKRIERGLLSQGLIAVTAIGTAGWEYGGDAVRLAQGGSVLFNQKYSRDAERESDYYGTQMMARAGYDPYAAVTLQQKFVALSGSEERAFLDGLLASHPASTERVENNRGLVKRLRSEGFASGHFGQAEYARAMDELRAAQPAYDAYDAAVADFREGKLDAALSRVNDALSSYPKEALFHGLRGAIRQSQKRLDDAVINYDRAIARDPNYFVYHLRRGMAHRDLGNRPAARQDLDHSVRLLPTSDALQALGALAEADGDMEAAKRYYAQAASGQDGASTAARESLVRLEIADQPAKYVTARLVQDDAGTHYLEVINRTPVALTNVLIRIDADAGDGVRSRSVRIDALEGSGRVTRRLEFPAGLLDARAYALAAAVAN